MLFSVVARKTLPSKVKADLNTALDVWMSSN